MADDLVLVRYDLGDEYEITPRGRALAEAKGLDVLEESAYDPHTGAVVQPRRVRKRSGRPAKPQTTASDEAAKKQQQAAVTESAPTEKEQNR